MTMIEALVALGALTFVTLGNEIFFTYATQGLGYGFSSNRPAVSFSPLAKRISRVYANQGEASSYMVPILWAIEKSRPTASVHSIRLDAYPFDSS